MSNRAPVIAIDGPAGSGKSTVANRLAGKLGLTYLDSGAMYRAVTWKAIEDGIDLNDHEALAAAAREMRVELKQENDLLKVLADGIDVTEAIRDPALTAKVRCVAPVAPVREVVGVWQRRIARDGGVVAEGRDMTTVVFPDADVKIYLDASVEVRARRRFEQLRAAGREADIRQIENEIAERDRTDIERDVAPLRKADDAVYIDTTNMGINDVIARLVDGVEARQRPDRESR